MKKWLLIIISALALTGTGLFVVLKNGYTLILTESQINQSMQSRTVYSKQHLSIFTISVRNPAVTLNENSGVLHLAAELDFQIQLLGRTRKYSGSVLANSEVRYARQTHQFILSSPQISQLHIEGIPDKYSAKASSAASLALREYCERRPIYTLQHRPILQRMARHLLDEISIEDRALHVRFQLK